MSEDIATSTNSVDGNTASYVQWRNDFLKKWNELPQCIASIDVGQTYIATSIFDKKTTGILPINQLKLPLTEEQTLEDQEKLLTDYKYEMVHLSIDEFAKNSAPHQPINMMADAKLQAAQFVEQGRSAGDNDTGRGGLLKKRKTKHGAKTSKPRVNVPLESNNQNMSEMTAVKAAAELIRTYYHEFGITLVVIEDQLPTVRRNRVIQAALYASCHAMGIKVANISPSLKFGFASKELLKLYHKSRGRKSSTLKTISKDLFEEIGQMFQADAEEKTKKDSKPSLTPFADLCMIDMQSVFGKKEMKEFYYDINQWYRKDLTDAFWQSIFAFKMKTSDFVEKKTTTENDDLGTVD